MFPARIRAVVRNLLHRQSVERELDEEVRDAYQSMVEARIAAGDALVEARRSAALEFGGLEQVKEQVREKRAGALAASIIQDVHYAQRGVRRRPWFALSVELTLALATGAANTVFTMLNAMVLRPLPFPAPKELMFLGTRDARHRDGNASYLDWQDWRTASSFAGVAAYARATFTLGDAAIAPEQTPGLFASANLFRLLGLRSAVGRDFLPQDDVAGAPSVVLLGDGLWRSRYGADANIVGRVIRVNGTPTTVIGVMEPGLKFDWTAQAWRPLQQMPGLAAQRRDARTVLVLGRLAPGMSIPAAQADIDAIAARLARAYPDSNRDITARVVPLRDQMVGKVSDPIFVTLLVALAAVLLIAGANVGSLFLARAACRDREIATQAALGASRWRIIRQFVMESAILVLVSGALALGISQWGASVLAASFEGYMPYFVRVTTDGRVSAFLAVVVTLFALLFGAWPARVLSQLRIHEFSRIGAGGGHPRVQRWIHALLVGQLALTLTLLAGAAIMGRSFFNLYRLDAPIAASEVVTARVGLPAARYPTNDSRSEFYRRLVDRLNGASGGMSSALATALPFTPIGVVQRRIGLNGRTAEPGAPPMDVATVLIGGGYFDVLGTTLVSGRDFNGQDGWPGHMSAIVNRLFARRFLPDIDPIGQRLQVSMPNGDGPDLLVTIVGIAPTIRQTQVDPVPVMYLPYQTNPSANAILFVRGGPGIEAAIAASRRVAQTIDPEIALGITSLQDTLRLARLPVTLVATLFIVFALLALLFSVVGLYAVMSYTVVRQTPEIGIRTALGATSRSIVWTVLRRACMQLGIGVTVGLAGAFLVVRLLQASLTRANSIDPWLLASIVVLLVAVGLAACVVPARRASRLDPMIALRSE